MLTDSFHRPITYLRLSVADKCNMRCFYCIPHGFTEFSDTAHFLSFDQVERVVRIFAKLGVSRLRLTGGEPLVRPNLTQLVQRLSSIETIEDISLSTNAALLAAQAADLKTAGIKRINVSLDSLNPDTFHDITGGKLAPVLEGLEAAAQHDMHPIKINMVVMRGVNDHEVLDMIEYCLERQFTLRFIEAMPVGNTGQETSANHYISLNDIKPRIAQRFPISPIDTPEAGPADYFQIENSPMKIGFITPMSQHFCQTCNRVRLSVEGTLYLCLGQNDKLELKPLLDSDVSDKVIEEAIVDAILRKPEKHEFNEMPGQVIRLMSQTGG
jgi:GTP 3',8-cyclase